MAYIPQEPGDILTRQQVTQFYDDSLQLVVLARSMARKCHEIIEIVDRYDGPELMLSRMITTLGERVVEAGDLTGRMCDDYAPAAGGRHPAWYSALRDIDLELADITGHVVKLKTSQERRCYRQARTDAELILGILGVVFECFGKIRIGRRPIHALAGRARLRRREKSEPITIEDIWK